MSIDLTPLISFLGTVNPTWGAIGAAVLFLIQLMGGSKVNVSGTVKTILGIITGGSAAAPASPAPPAPPTVPVPPITADHPILSGILTRLGQLESTVLGSGAPGTPTVLPKS